MSAIDTLDPTDPYHKQYYTEAMYWKDKARMLERSFKDKGNGSWQVFKDVVFMAVMLGSFGLVWRDLTSQAEMKAEMNQRLAKLETVLYILAQKNGINVQ